MDIKIGDLVYINFGWDDLNPIPGKVRVVKILGDGNFISQMGNNPHQSKHNIKVLRGKR